MLCHSGAGRLGTLKYNSFRWRSIRMFNRLPKSIRKLSSCSVVGFKSKLGLDSYLRNIVDLIIVWTVVIAYMVVITRMTCRPI